MKKILSISLMLVLLLTLTSCKSKEEKQLENADEALEEISDIQNRIDSGELSADEADGLTNKVESDVAKANGTYTDELPKWAKKLGLTEAKGLEFVTGDEATEKKDKFNAIVLEYKGTPDQVIKEANRIAKKADLSLNPEFEKMQKMFSDVSNMPELEDMPEEAKLQLQANIPKSVIYSNFSFTADINEGPTDGSKYSIAVIAQNGELTISAVDYANAIKYDESFLDNDDDASIDYNNDFNF